MSNAKQRTTEIRNLLVNDPDLDPFLVSRVLKLCRMHDSQDEALRERESALELKRKEVEEAANQQRAGYDRLILRLQNQRVEITRLQRRLDECEASKGTEARPLAEFQGEGWCEYWGGIPNDNSIRGKASQPEEAERNPVPFAWLTKTDLPSD